MKIFINKNELVFGSFYLSIFLVSIYLISHQLAWPGNLSDTQAHLSFVKSYMDGTKYIPHPLWHICVHYMDFFTLNNKSSAVLVTSFFILLWTYLLHKIVHYFLTEDAKNEVKAFRVIIIVFGIFIVGPAYLPFLNDHIYLGTGSPNIWHNVTLFTVKPFALLTTFLTVLALKNNNTKYYISSLIFFTLSMFAKPSFAIVFIPALFLYFVIKNNYQKPRVTFLLALLLLFLSISFFQYTNTFGTKHSKIIIDFLGVWSLYSPNILISILLALCFPLLFLLLNYKVSLADDWIVLSWIMVIISIIVFALFAEEGAQYHAGNFGWSYMIAITMLYIFVIIKFINTFTYFGKSRRYFLSAILLYQVGIGIYYLFNILNGENYY